MKYSYNYCGGVILADMEQFVANGANDIFRKYFNNINVNKKQNFEVNDQQLMNELRSYVKIHTLSWRWVWTEILYKDYGDSMRHLANIIDFHGS